MSLELQAAQQASIDQLWAGWSSTPTTELEATFPSLDYSTFLQTLKYLRSLGFAEVEEDTKLNIMVEGGLRFTLVGDGLISEYCKDDSLKGKPFEILLKERKTVAGGVAEIDLREYGVRIKARRETVLAKDHSRVADVLPSWSTIQKSFRQISRYTFTSAQHKGVRFDLSIVRESKKDGRGSYIPSTTFTGAQITKQPLRYEVEVEVLHGREAEKHSFLVGIATVLRGIQGSYVFLRDSVRTSVLGYLAQKTGSAPTEFIGSQPITLRKTHIGIDPEARSANIRTEDYNVTDKADGLRCLLLVTPDGRVHLIDRNLRVFGTDRKLDASIADEWAGTLLDGEWVTADRNGKPMSAYLAFDIYQQRGKDVSALPFFVRTATAPFPLNKEAPCRHKALEEATGILNRAKHLYTKIPDSSKLSIQMKKFETPERKDELNGIFAKAKLILFRSETAPYHTDGLIFTPNADPLPKHESTWMKQFKWKPAEENSVDFLVLTERERNEEGRPTAKELIETHSREDTHEMVAHKTLRLFVGSKVDPAFEDPRQWILSKSPLPTSLRGKQGEYRAVEFAPEPPDPMASLCYVPLHDPTTEEIRCESGDPIMNRTIVEMVYKPENSAGWRWVPLRVRWDKTELYARGKKSMNNEAVAEDVWQSIHDPITKHMITTGSLSEESSSNSSSALAAGTGAYYQRKAPQQDLSRISGHNQFHNDYIKNQILLGRTLRDGAGVLDMSVGQAGDIHKWIRARVGFVLGCDLALTGLTYNRNGAYRRYLNELIKARGEVPPMLFVQADASVRYKDGSSGQTPLDRSMLRALWGEPIEDLPVYVKELRGYAAKGFDVVSMMFTLHYLFKDRTMVDGFLQNVADTLKVGGYFVGCCFDGNTVTSLLRDKTKGQTRLGSEDGVDLWSITKQYDDPLGILPATEEGLGRAIDVFFISLGGKPRTEYLVSFDYLVKRMAEIGLDLLNAEELAAMKLRDSSNLFSVSNKMAADNGYTYKMSPVVKQFSDLNRWFIFRRRSTGPLSAGPAGLRVLTGLAPAVATTATAAAAVAATATATVVPTVAPKGGSIEHVEEPISEPVIVLEEPVADVADFATATAADVATAAMVAAEAEAVAEPEAVTGGAQPVADGPLFSFYHKSPAKDELKVGNKHWRRTLSPYAHFLYTDPSNPAIKYSSLEAALGSAKFQLATDKPELGPQLFSTTGNIAQETAEKKRASPSPTPEQLAEWAEEEGTKMRDAQKPIAFRRVKAKFDEAAWKGKREAILHEYVHQRFEGDKTFRTYLEAVGHKKGRLVYYTAGGPTELSASVKEEVIEGENLLGKAYLKEIGFRF